jgi:hypothetical protein
VTRRQLISTAEAKPVKGQPDRPCSDCPFSRQSLRGWLGGATPNEYRRLAHSNQPIYCHALIGVQCAGAAIYRANVCKRAGPPNIELPADRNAVFATPMEFLAHHYTRGS